ncbi:hypothetical protein BC826DRAFT_1045764 [Russula brevipes]|nr:hypothetical protein BC826DRAFT_1045764 [Russula brevipes]
MRVMAADGLPPIEQLTSMLRPTVERLLEQDAAAREDTQDTQDATPVELLPTEQVGESSSHQVHMRQIQYLQPSWKHMM